jgi:catechol 2,3-dioxygenase-like lactoylglutathione lyase family enzyme
MEDKMITGYRHIGLVVRDLKRSRDFYERILGFKLWKEAVETGAFIEAVVGIPGVVLEWVKLRAPDGSLLELLQYHTHPDEETPCQIRPANQIGCSHMAFTVKDIAGLHRLLTEQGFLCNSKPQTASDGAVEVMYCHDPDGIILELVEEKSHES